MRVSRIQGEKKNSEVDASVRTTEYSLNKSDHRLARPNLMTISVVWRTLNAHPLKKYATVEL